MRGFASITPENPVSHDYDLIVIGGGSGGLAHAQRAAEYGASVLVIESDRLGGTCVNVGCVPKKVMWYAASMAHEIEAAADFGFDTTRNGHDWQALKRSRDAYIKRLNGIYAGNLDKRKVELVRGRAAFAGPHAVRVGDREFTAAHITVATGGHPIIPDVPGAELGITSDDFFELQAMPSRVALLGSGYVSVELAGVFNALGADTAVFTRYDGVLRSFDSMLREEVMDAMRRDGILLEHDVIPAALERSPQGITIVATSGQRFAGYDAVVWAAGRAPSTADLALEAAGVDRDDDGFIPVDKYQVTNVAHIYSLGDVTGAVALTPVAIAAGRRLADRVFGGMDGRHLDYRMIPTVIFSHPPMGTVGMTEEEAHREYGEEARVFTSRFTPMRYALGEKKSRAAMKLVTVGDDARIVGCHVIGDGADEMMQGFAVAIRMGATKQDFDDTVAIHPTSAEELVTMR
jgi:glutathione reductase (NADPH)